MQITPGPTAEQGPSVITSYVLDPPGWLIILFLVASTVVVLKGARNLHSRDWSLSLDIQREMLVIASTATLVAFFTLSSLTVFNFGYFLDVLVGFALGFGVVQILQAGIVQDYIPWSRRLRITVGWTVLVVILVVAFPLIATTYVRALVWFQAILSVACAGLVGYNSKIGVSSTT